MKREHGRDTAKVTTSIGTHAETGKQMLFSEEDFDNSSTKEITDCPIYIYFLIQQRRANGGSLKRREENVTSLSMMEALECFTFSNISP